MSPTAQAPSSPARPSSSQQTIAASALRINSWNPNRMTAAMYAKALESIETYGFVDPLLVRPHPDQAGFFEIIDGEHRFRAGGDLGMGEFPCVVLTGLTDAAAQKLTIISNELHGQADPDKMGDLLRVILEDTSLDELLNALPYDESILAGFLGLPDLPPLEPPPTPGEAPSDKAVWAERLYRMPKEVALVVDEAIEKAKDGEEIEQWQGLERVAADYLAS